MTQAMRAGGEPVAVATPPRGNAMDGGDELKGYTFPRDKFISLKHAAQRVQDKIPVVLVACGR